MTWKSFDELTSSDIATEHFGLLLDAIREDHADSLVCVLDELVHERLTGGEVLYFDGIKKPERLPMSATISFEINDENGILIADRNFMGHISRPLDRYSRFKGYSHDTSRMIKHQAGVRLRNLMPLERDLYFIDNIFNKGKKVSVDETLLANLIIPSIGEKIDTLRYQ